MKKIIYSVMREGEIGKGVSLVLAAMLAGCAATPPIQSEPEPATGSGASTMAQNRVIPHRYTTNITGPGISSVPAAQDRAGVDPAIQAKAGDKSASKVQIFPGTGVFVKAPTPPAPGAKPAGGDEVMLNFDGADLREVVKAIVVDFLKETYIMDSKVQGTVSLHTTNPIPRTALLPTLETLLRMNGAAIVKDEGIFKVVPAGAAVRGSITPQLGGGKRPLQSGYTVQIVPLKFLSAKEMTKILEPFVADATAMRIDEVRNLMILSGTETELRHLLETIDMFDVDWLAGMSVGLFTLQSVDAKTAVGDLDKIFGAGAQSPLAGVVRLVPIERLNAVLVITPQPKYLEQAKVWVERMDRAGGAGGGTRLFVYQVQNGQAEKLATLLNDVFSKSKSTKLTPAATLAPGLAPAVATTTPAIAPPGGAMPPATAAAQAAGAGDNVSVSGDIRVIADKDNNALLTLASPSDYDKIESAIRRLDVAPRQVLIDVTIAEVTLKDEFQFGLEWYFGKALATASATGGIFNGGNSTRLGAAGLSNTSLHPWNNSLAGVALTLLANDSRVKVISSPHIMVTDNQKAQIQVGDQVPTTSSTQSGVATTSGIISTVQYLNTGTLLTITPHINAGGMVTMEINQEVSQATKTVTSGIDSPTITRRAIQSTVVVKSGETMVLGGLIQEDKNKSSSGLPLLSQIPVLGGLFGTQTLTDNRTELVIMITPRVVTSSVQAREVTDEFRKKLGGLSDYFDKSEKFDDKTQSQKPEKLDGQEKQEKQSPRMSN